MARNVIESDDYKTKTQYLPSGKYTNSSLCMEIAK